MLGADQKDCGLWARECPFTIENLDLARVSMA